MKHSLFEQHHKTVRWLIVPILCLCGTAVLTFTPLRVPERMRVYLRESMAPLLTTTVSMEAEVMAIVESVESKESLVRENIRLHQELSDLRHASFMTEVLKSENERLRRLVRTSGKVEKSIQATVIAGPVGGMYESLLIDIGTEDGVKERSLVLDSTVNVALGYVGSVGPRSAQVTLFSAPTHMFEVLLRGASTTRVVAEGQGSGGFRVQVPRSVSVAVGDPVLLPMEYPYLLATVESLTGESSDPIITAWFKSPISFHELRSVQVIEEAWIVPENDTAGKK